MEPASAQPAEMDATVKADIERFKKIVTTLSIQQE
jgi:hypothetical protein